MTAPRIRLHLFVHCWNVFRHIYLSIVGMFYIFVYCWNVLQTYDIPQNLELETVQGPCFFFIFIVMFLLSSMPWSKKTQVSDWKAGGKSRPCFLFLRYKEQHLIFTASRFFRLHSRRWTCMRWCPSRDCQQCKSSLSEKTVSVFRLFMLVHTNVCGLTWSQDGIVFYKRPDLLFSMFCRMYSSYFD